MQLPDGKSDGEQGRRPMKPYNWIADFQAKERAELTKRHLALVALWIGIVCLMVLAMAGGCSQKAWAFECETSYFTRTSCIKESGQCVMANGRELQDEGQYLAASWDFKLNSYIRVKNLHNGREIVAKVGDRGPAKRLYKRGRRLDLNLAAARALGFVKQGLAKVEVTEVNND